jgi:hypothetical protein
MVRLSLLEDGVEGLLAMGLLLSVAFLFWQISSHTHNLQPLTPS